MSTAAPVSGDVRYTRGKIAVIASRWNEAIVGRLLEGCLARLGELGAPAESVRVMRVPGAYELPLAAMWAVTEKGFDAVIVIGCVIRGETWHFEAVAGECARGVMDVGLRTGRPVIFGVLTVENEAQAWDRAGGKDAAAGGTGAAAGGSHGHAGRAAAEAVLEMLALRA